MTTLDRLKDLRTTIPGLLFGLALIASALWTMKVRPDWGIPEILGLVGGVGTIALGAWSTSAKAAADDAAPAAPKVPPIVGGLLLGVGIGVLVVAAPLAFAGCTPAERGAVKSVVDHLAPGCVLINVATGSDVWGQLCKDAAAAADALFAARAGKLGAAPCGDHVAVIDAGGNVVGWACANIAPVVAAKIGGRVAP